MWEELIGSNWANFLRSCCCSHSSNWCVLTCLMCNNSNDSIAGIACHADSDKNSPKYSHPAHVRQVQPSSQLTALRISQFARWLGLFDCRIVENDPHMLCWDSRCFPKTGIYKLKLHVDVVPCPIHNLKSQIVSIKNPCTNIFLFQHYSHSRSEKDHALL